MIETLADKTALLESLGVSLTFTAGTCFGIPNSTEQILQLDTGSLRYVGKDRYFLVLATVADLLFIQVNQQFTWQPVNKLLTYKVVQIIQNDDGWVKLLVNLVGTTNV